MPSHGKTKKSSKLLGTIGVRKDSGSRVIRLKNVPGKKLFEREKPNQITLFKIFPIFSPNQFFSSVDKSKLGYDIWYQFRVVAHSSDYQLSVSDIRNFFTPPRNDSEVSVTSVRHLGTTMRLVLNLIGSKVTY